MNAGVDFGMDEKYSLFSWTLWSTGSVLWQKDNFVIWNYFVVKFGEKLLDSLPFSVSDKGQELFCHEPGNISWRFMEHGRNSHSMTTNLTHLLLIKSYEGDFSWNLDLSVLYVQVISFCKSLGLRKYLTVLWYLNLDTESWPLRSLKSDLDSNSLLSQSSEVEYS